MRRHAKASSAGSNSSKARPPQADRPSRPCPPGDPRPRRLPRRRDRPERDDPNAENVEYTTAEVKGTVDPGDHFTEYHFEVATEADFSNVSASAGFGSFAENEGVKAVEAEFTGKNYGQRAETRHDLPRAPGCLKRRRPGRSRCGFHLHDQSGCRAYRDDRPGHDLHRHQRPLRGGDKPNAPGDNPGDSLFDVEWHFQCTPSCPGIEGEQTIKADGVNHTVEVNASRARSPTPTTR